MEINHAALAGANRFAVGLFGAVHDDAEKRYRRAKRRHRGADKVYCAAAVLQCDIQNKRNREGEQRQNKGRQKPSRILRR